MEKVLVSDMAYPIVKADGIESVQDLFGLYARLSQPLKEMEKVCERQETLQKELKNAKETISSAFITPFVSAIVWTIVLGIPFIILFIIVSNVAHAADGRTLFDVYDNWLSGTAFGQKYLEALPNDASFGSAILLLLSVVIWSALFPCVIFLLPATFVLSLIVTVISVILAKNVVKKNTAEIPVLQSEIDGRIRAMSDALSYVPPDYRFSMAIDHFCQSYANQKADSLKEAVNLFDVYMHQQKMEQKQQEILDVEHRKLSELTYQSAQLEKMNREIKQIRRDVDWMSW